MSWSDSASEAVEAGATDALRSYRSANALMIRASMLGHGPDSSTASDEAGMRVVFNMSSAHLPAFFAAGSCTPSNRPYQNRYDRRGRGAGLGSGPSRPGLRERVDEVVAEAGSSDTELAPQDIYYGAVELNGAGIRYFGDASMVLKPAQVPAGTLVLYRNSYDLSRMPVVRDVYVPDDHAATHRLALAKLCEWQGVWPADPPDMAACKILEAAPPAERRLTTGTVSSGILTDEDYFEVARRGSFGGEDLEEIRLFSADAAAEARIADRTTSGPPASLAELQWRHRRRAAERAAATHGIRMRVAVTLGRDRG